MSSKNMMAAALAAMLLLTPTVLAAQQDFKPGPATGLDPRAASQRRPDPNRFSKQVDAFLEADRQNPQPSCQILFIGSASIVAWRTLKADMAPAPVFARGLGASTIQDQIYFFDKIVAPYKPRAIFFYATENDIVNGLTPDEVFADLIKFMDLKTKVLGSTPVYFIAAKASPARLASAADQQKANERARALAGKRKDLIYIDVAHAMWENGKVLGKLKPIFVPDGIHLNPEGYRIWTSIIKPYVDKEAARKNACPAG